MTSEVEESRGLAVVPWSSSALYVILLSSLIGVMGVSLISPTLPDLRAVFGVSDAQVGLVITAYTLPGIFITPFVGLVADRVGRRRVIVPLLFTFGLAGAGVSFTNSFTQVLVLRFIQGVGASALITLAVTLIGDYYSGNRRNAVMGLNGSAIGTGAAFFPLVGGILATIRWSAPFLFFGVAVLVGLTAAVVLPEPETEAKLGVREYLSSLAGIVFLPRALAVFLAIFWAFFLLYGGILTALPLLLSDEFLLSAGQIGALLAVESLASATIASQYGRLTASRTAPQLIALAFVGFGAGFVGLWLAPSPLFVAVALLSFGVGWGIMLPSFDTTLLGLVSGQFRAGMMGMRTSMIRLGQTLGPIGFTFVAEAGFATPVEGYHLLLLVSGTVSIVAGLVSYLLVRR
ncbi:MAG: MFS transporter [Halobacteriota archaeon]